MNTNEIIIFTFFYKNIDSYFIKIIIQLWWGSTQYPRDYQTFRSVGFNIFKTNDIVPNSNLVAPRSKQPQWQKYFIQATQRYIVQHIPQNTLYSKTPWKLGKSSSISILAHDHFVNFLVVKKTVILHQLPTWKYGFHHFLSI